MLQAPIATSPCGTLSGSATSPAPFPSGGGGGLSPQPSCQSSVFSTGTLAGVPAMGGATAGVPQVMSQSASGTAAGSASPTGKSGDEKFIIAMEKLFPTGNQMI